MSTESEDPREFPEREDFEDRWKRALADAENLRKRCAKELAAAHAAERRRVAATFLPVADNLDLAVAHAEAADDPLVQGISAVRDQLLGILAEHGFDRDDETGVGFDPVRHEAVGMVDGGEPGTVVSVVRPGYGTGEDQLRPAAVMVAGPAHQEG